jgi:hypothetical protein
MGDRPVRPPDGPRGRGGAGRGGGAWPPSPSPPPQGVPDNRGAAFLVDEKSRSWLETPRSWQEKSPSWQETPRRWQEKSRSWAGGERSGDESPAPGTKSPALGTSRSIPGMRRGTPGALRTAPDPPSTRPPPCPPPATARPTAIYRIPPPPGAIRSGRPSAPHKPPNLPSARAGSALAIGRSCLFEGCQGPPTPRPAANSTAADTNPSGVGSRLGALRQPQTGAADRGAGERAPGDTGTWCRRFSQLAEGWSSEGFRAGAGPPHRRTLLGGQRLRQLEGPPAASRQGLESDRSTEPYLS